MFFGTLTIANDGFSIVFGLPNHWNQWFSMVKDHWSNDGMVSMDRTGLSPATINPEGQHDLFKQGKDKIS